MEQTEPKKKINTKTILGLVVAVAVYVLVQQFFFKPQSFDKAMMAAASEINKSCPIMIDQETRLDNTIALPDNIFQYNYTLINLQKDSLDIRAIQDKIEPTIVNNVKTNPDMKDYRSNKVTMGYYYKDRNGEFLFKILVTPDRYKTDD